MQFVLLDDVHSHRDTPSSRLYTHPQQHWAAYDADQLDTTLKAIEDGLQEGLHLVVLFSYELGYLLGQSPKTFLERSGKAGSASVSTHGVKHDRSWISAYGFKEVAHLNAHEVDAFLAKHIAEQPPRERHAGVVDLRHDIDEKEFHSAIATIHDHIRAGDVYQVNYTFRLHGRYYGHPIALYQRLRERQPTAFRALVHTDHETVLSLSPELFLRHHNGKLVAQPMKGTWNKADRQPTITPDEKNRAENLMIVDLLRNDLGRISKVGSVKVPQLYQLEDIGSLVQMTSTIESQLIEGLGLKEILAATFPCGSVTGAPKQMAMQVIHGLERSPRGLYCGGIGWFDPPQVKAAPLPGYSRPASSTSSNSTSESRIGDFAMSVAIRTLALNTNDQSFVMGIGSGITIDSDPVAEWQECLAKGRFLSELPAEVGLIETMRCADGAISHRQAHIERLMRSAVRLGIPCGGVAVTHGRERLPQQDLNASIEQAIDHALSGLGSEPHRIRVELMPDGRVSVTTGALLTIAEPVAVFWAHAILSADNCRVRAGDVIASDKTTAREHYDAAWQEAERRGGFDALFINDRGEVTEGGRTSVFAKVNGQWCTPPLDSGVLPGVMRGQVLADPQWNAKEVQLRPADLERCEELVVVNALRGVLRAQLMPVTSPLTNSTGGSGITKTFG